MNDTIEYDPATGEELEFGCIMRGIPDERGECDPSSHCPGCDQARRIRARLISPAINSGVLRRFLDKEAQQKEMV